MKSKAWYGLFGYVTLLVAMSVMVTGCKEEPTPQYYYYESFRVSITNFNSVDKSNRETFDAIKNVRNQLNQYSVEFMGSDTGIVQADIYTLLTQHGSTPSDANTRISDLNRIGNAIAAFTYVYDRDNYYIIFYVEKI
ncbi:MAG: hypothetical protein LBQ77_07130 [Treponema sp.]|jgi:hypothetical protein|nr:hypothetical protein [Treponema sp.]